MPHTLEWIDHTADECIHVIADSAGELFETAAVGMLSIIVDPKSVQAVESWPIRVESDDVEDLLLKWLREILFIMERDGVVVSKVHIEEENLSFAGMDKYYIFGLLRGEIIDLSRHGICTEIKAITRHGLDIHHSHAWEATILFDL